MTPRSMLLHLFLCRLTGVGNFLELLDLLFQLLLNVYLLAVSNILISGAYKMVIRTVPFRGVQRFTILFGSYR